MVIQLLPAPLPHYFEKKIIFSGSIPSPILAHVYCGQTAGWLKMALGMEVGVGPGHIVLDGHPAPLPKPNFRPMSTMAKRLDGSR